jgi:hypothetical protein
VSFAPPAFALRERIDGWKVGKLDDDLKIDDGDLAGEILRSAVKGDFEGVALRDEVVSGLLARGERSPVFNHRPAY